MHSDAKTVARYLAELSGERREIVSAVRKVILANLGRGYEEGMQCGMIGYYVPHSVYPKGYHVDPRQPLPFACLASQKNHISLYLNCLYMDPKSAKAFQRECAASGKKLNMGKSCIRFKKLDDLPLAVVAKAIQRISVKKFIIGYEAALAAPRKKLAPARTVKAKAVKDAKPKPTAMAVRKKRAARQTN